VRFIHSAAVKRDDMPAPVDSTPIKESDINWEKLVAFNSGRDKPQKTRFVRDMLEDEYQTTLD
jgi:hypothetical protein